MADLRTCQIWLQGQIVGATPSNPAEWVRSDYGLEASQRVLLYRSMYPLRMREALEIDYPATAAALGDRRFGRLVAAYLQAHPSTSWTLNRLGDDFPRFLAGRPRQASLFVRQLASLELELCRIFEAPERPALPPGCPLISCAPGPAAASWPLAIPCRTICSRWTPESTPQSRLGKLNTC